MLENLKLFARVIRANPKPYLAIAAGAATAHTLTVIYVVNKVLGESKLTLLLNDEMLEALHNGGSVYFRHGDETIRAHFDA